MAITDIPAGAWTSLPAPGTGSRAFSNVGAGDAKLSFVGAVAPNDGFVLPVGATVFFDTGSDWIGKAFAAYSVTGTVVSTTEV